METLERLKCIAETAYLPIYTEGKSARVLSQRGINQQRDQSFNYVVTDTTLTLGRGYVCEAMEGGVNTVYDPRIVERKSIKAYVGIPTTRAPSVAQTKLSKAMQSWMA
eukprot:scaffold12195_cov126-Cylindrotheca_fusiformis.AAC.5